MEILTTPELVKKLIQLPENGLEVSLCMGMIKRTKALYSRNGFIYIFSLEDRFLFNEANQVNITDFINEYEKWTWYVDQVIS